VPEQLLATHEPIESQAGPAGLEEELRKWARQHVSTCTSCDCTWRPTWWAAPVRTPIWALTQWTDHGGFKRLSFDVEGQSGVWEPWILPVALVWGLVVAIRAESALRRPTMESRSIAGADTEVARVSSNGS
jgi:hypothetical protein